MNPGFPNPQMLSFLLDKYYNVDSDDSPSAAVTSSHWKYWGDKIRVQLDDQGRLVALKGAGFGFGEGRWGHTPLHALMDLLTAATHLAKLEKQYHLNPFWEEVKSICIQLDLPPNVDALRYACTAALLKKHFSNLRNHGALRFLMIGDGYGVLGILLKKIFPNSQLVMVDLGKTLLFQCFYAQKFFPALKHVLLGKDRDLTNADFIFCPAESLSDLNDFKFDVAINIASMQEMSPAVVANYFAFLRTHLTASNLLYCCNRESKTLPSGELLEFFRYPWKANDKHLVDELCPWHQEFFSPFPFSRRNKKLLGIPIPFFHFYDGSIYHRLTILAVDQ
jgi:hypothetical protein